jgi:hypothetical protein
LTNYDTINSSNSANLPVAQVNASEINNLLAQQQRLSALLAELVANKEAFVEYLTNEMNETNADQLNNSELLPLFDQHYDDFNEWLNPSPATNQDSTENTVATVTPPPANISSTPLPAVPPAATQVSNPLPIPSTPPPAKVLPVNPAPVSPPTVAVPPASKVAEVVPVDNVVSQTGPLDEPTITNEEELAAPTTPEEPQIPQIIINGTLNRDIVVTMADNSWYPLNNTPDNNLQFIRKEYAQDGSVRFIFKALKTGQYNLDFRRNGPFGVEDIRVIINVADGRLPTSTLPKEGDTLDNSTIVPDMVGDINDFIANAIINNDSATLKKRANEVLVASQLPQMSRDEFVNLLRFTTQKAELVDLSGQLINVFLQRFPFANEGAEFLYRLGQLYEADNDIRNFDRSYSYYNRVFNDYPISPYSRLSKERMDFLNRFYIRIPS